MRINDSDIQLHNEDYIHVIRKISDNSVDCVLTDPPYAINFQGKKGPEKNWDKLTDVEYEALLFDFLSESYRVLKPGASCWFFFAPTKIKTVLSVAESTKFTLNLENWSIFARNKGRGSKFKVKSLREDILHVSKGPYNKFNYVEYLRRVVAPYVKDGKPRGWFLDQNTGEPMRWSGLGNVACFTPPSFNNKFERQIHSTQKPVLLLAELQMLCTKRGDIVLDPFMGSGSTGIAAVLSNRHFIGCERDKNVYDSAVNWFNNYNHAEAENYVKRIRSNETVPR